MMAKQERDNGTRKRRATGDDAAIGQKIRALRLRAGLSQSKLADQIDLTFQQVQKYEKGTNRVSAGRLSRIAEVLGVPITLFYNGLGAAAIPRRGASDVLAFVQTKGAMRLVRAYSEIRSRAARYALVVTAEGLRDRKAAE